MNKKQNILILLAKRLVFYSLPMIAVLYIVYEVIDRKSTRLNSSHH